MYQKKKSVISEIYFYKNEKSLQRLCLINFRKVYAYKQL